MSVVQCFKCEEELEGNWEMNISDEFPDGRYLGVKACFYYGETECSLVYPYCAQCYKTTLVSTTWLRNHIKSEIIKVYLCFKTRIDRRKYAYSSFCKINHNKIYPN